jgi:hypothetical protein
MSVIKKWLPVLFAVLIIAGMTFWTSCSGGLRWDESDPHMQGLTKIEVKTVESTAAEKETVSEAQETAAKSNVKGVIYETDKFSILVPDGWEAENVPTTGGANVVITKDKDAMQLIAGTPLEEIYTEDIPDAATFCEKQVEHMAEALNGTAPEEVMMFGIKFFKTSYTLDDRDQTVFYGDRNGDIVTMLMAGKDHQNNVEIKAMQESIKFK